MWRLQKCIVTAQNRADSYTSIKRMIIKHSWNNVIYTENRWNVFVENLSSSVPNVELLLQLPCVTPFPLALCPRRHIPVLPVWGVMQKLTVSQLAYHRLGRIIQRTCSVSNLACRLLTVSSGVFRIIDLAFRYLYLLYFEHEKCDNCFVWGFYFVKYLCL